MSALTRPQPWTRWVRFTRFDAYIVRQFLLYLLFILGMFTVVIMVIDAADKMNQFWEQKLSLGQIFGDYYANFLTYILNKFFPLYVFLAVVAFTARMSQSSEIIALLSSGTSFYRLLLPYVVTALMLASFSYFLNAYIVPHSTRDYQAFESRYLKSGQQTYAKNIHRKIDQQSFLFLRNYNHFDRRAYEGTIEERTGNLLRRKLSFQLMEWIDSTKKWRLVVVTERYIDGERETLVRRNQVDTTLKLSPSDLYRHENAAESLTMPELNEYIRLERERGSDFIKQLLLRREERVAFAFATLILTVIGFALSSQKRRGGIGLQIGLGLLLAFTYLLLQNTATVLIGDAAPVWIAVWLPNVLFAAMAVGLIRVAPK